METVFLLLIFEVVLLLTTMIFTSFDYTSPSFLALSMFILSTISMICNFEKWNIVFHEKTLFVMLSGLSIMVIVEMLVKEIYSKNSNGLQIVDYEEPFISGSTTKIIILISSLLMSFIYVREIYAIGARINIGNMISAIGAVKQSEFHTGVLATICLRVGYALSNLYGFIFCHNVIISKQKIRQNIYLIVSMIAGIVSSIYSGSRGMLLGTIISFFFYIIIYSRIRKGWKEVKLKKYLKYIIPSCVAFFIVFFISRNLVKNREYSSTPFDYLTYYLGNSQQLLNLSLNDTNAPFPIQSSLPGLYSFQFFYNELAGLGIISLPDRISSGFLQIGKTYSERGNVYTLFGEPYHDFGFVGMLIYVALFFFVFCHYYYKYIRYWKNTSKNKKVLLIFGSQYYLVFFTFYLAPTIWLKIQTLVTIIIVLLVYKVLTKYRFLIKTPLSTN